MYDENNITYRVGINWKDILVKIEDYIICEQRNIFTEHKIYCLSLKFVILFCI